MLGAIKDHRLDVLTSCRRLSRPQASRFPRTAPTRLEDFAQKWQMFKNNLASGPIATAGSSVFDFLNGSACSRVIDLLKLFNSEMGQDAIRNGGFVGPKAPGCAGSGEPLTCQFPGTKGPRRAPSGIAAASATMIQW
jgi:hypothetical protein